MHHSVVEVVMVALGAVLIAIGLFIAYGTVHTRRRAVGSLNWPTAAGTIVSSEVAVVTAHDMKNRPFRRYRADIHYEYEADGRTFVGDQMALGGSRETSRRDACDELVTRYPAGSRVDVYYDPSDPTTAILQPGSMSGVLNMMMVALGFLLVGGLVSAAGYFQWGH